MLCYYKYAYRVNVVYLSMIRSHRKLSRFFNIIRINIDSHCSLILSKKLFFLEYYNVVIKLVALNKNQDK